MAKRSDILLDDLENKLVDLQYDVAKQFERELVYYDNRVVELLVSVGANELTDDFRAKASGLDVEFEEMKRRFLDSYEDLLTKIAKLRASAVDD